MIFMMLPLSIKIVPATDTLKAKKNLLTRCLGLQHGSASKSIQDLEGGNYLRLVPPHAKFVWFQLYTVQTDSVKMITIVTLVPENLLKAAVIALPPSSCLRLWTYSLYSHQQLLSQ